MTGVTTIPAFPFRRRFPEGSLLELRGGGRFFSRSSLFGFETFLEWFLALFREVRVTWLPGGTLTMGTFVPFVRCLYALLYTNGLFALLGVRYGILLRSEKRFPLFGRSPRFEFSFVNMTETSNPFITLVTRDFLQLVTIVSRFVFLSLHSRFSGGGGLTVIG